MTGRASIFSFGIITVQILGVLILISLEILSGYRAGVTQHLYYHKLHYLNSLYGQDLLVVHGAGVILCALCLGALFFRKGRGAAVSGAWSALLCLVLAAAYMVPWFGELNVYAYLLIWLEICLVLEVGRAFGCGAGR